MKWSRREIMGRHEVMPLASQTVANDRTDLSKVGFVFLRRVMLMDTKFAR
jgi:hypothetical protein